MPEKTLRARRRRLGATALGACLVVAGLSPTPASAAGETVPTFDGGVVAGWGDDQSSQRTVPGSLNGPITALAGPVVGVPTVRLSGAATTLRRGQATTLTWTSTDATALTATGAWSGTRPAAGAIEIMPATIGTAVYALTATNLHGTVTAQIQIQVTRPAKHLEVTAPKGYHRAGTKIKVKVRGLEAGEAYTLRIGKQKVATGTAESTRPLVRTVVLPRAKGRIPGPATVRVTGDQPDRTDTTKVRVVDH